MGKNNRTTCKHFLRLIYRPGTPTTLWAKCRYCPRAWFLGHNAHEIASAAKAESR